MTWFRWLAKGVPWPGAARGLPFYGQAPAAAPAGDAALAEAATPTVRLCFRLSCLSRAEGVALLHEAARGQELWVADFVQAERNLAWPAVLLTRGLLELFWGAHRLSPWVWRQKEAAQERRARAAQHKALRQFWAGGGLEGAVRASGLTVLERQGFWGGAAALLRLEPINGAESALTTSRGSATIG